MSIEVTVDDKSYYRVDAPAIGGSYRVACYMDRNLRHLIANYMVFPQGMGHAARLVDLISFPTVWYPETDEQGCLDHISRIVGRML